LLAGDTVRLEVGGVGVLENKLVNGIWASNQKTYIDVGILKKTHFLLLYPGAVNSFKA
jgi:hypothetical protein